MITPPRFDPLTISEDDEVLDAFLTNRGSFTHKGIREVYSKVATIDRVKVVRIRKQWNTHEHEKIDIIKWHRDNTGDLGKEYIKWLVDCYDNGFLDDAVYVLTYAYKEGLALTSEQCGDAIETHIIDKLPMQWAVKMSAAITSDDIDHIIAERERLDQEKKTKIDSIRPTMSSLQDKLR